MEQQAKHTPGPWVMRNRPGAGLEIMAPVKVVAQSHGKADADRAPDQSPIFDLQDGIGLQYIMAYEIWTRFTPEWWDKMQEANARLIAAAPEMLEALQEVVATEMFLPDHPRRQAAYKAARAAIARATQP